MNVTLSRRLAAAILTVPVLASCGFDVQTDQVYTPADGANDRDGMVDVLNILVVADGEGAGRLITGLSNNDTGEADELTSVRGEGDDAGVTYTLLGGETEIPAGGFVQLADEGKAQIRVEGEGVVPGGFLTLTLTFANAEEVTVEVPVLANEGDYADIEIPESETQTETETEG